MDGPVTIFSAYALDDDEVVDDFYKRQINQKV